MIRKESTFEEILELTIQEEIMNGCISDSVTIQSHVTQYLQLLKSETEKNS